jgi:flavodoxin
MDYMVVYSSKTGNTKKVATEIFSALPGMSKDMQSVGEYRGKDADIFFVGFWVDRGTCDISVIDMLSRLHGKKVALFGTCGMGSDAGYFKMIEQKVKVWIPDDCEYLGTFLCQGNPAEILLEQIRWAYGENYGKEEICLIAGKGYHAERTEFCRQMLRNFDEGLFHPNEEDLAHARKFVERLLGVKG